MIFNNDYLRLLVTLKLHISMDIHGCPCISMDNLWTTMNIHGHPWRSMEIHGYQWIPMDIHWYPGISMDIHVNQSISMKNIYAPCVFEGFCWKECTRTTIFYNQLKVLGIITTCPVFLAFLVWSKEAGGEEECSSGPPSTRRGARMTIVHKLPQTKCFYVTFTICIK